jgi:hypothetical protein
MSAAAVWYSSAKVNIGSIIIEDECVLDINTTMIVEES